MKFIPWVNFRKGEQPKQTDKRKDRMKKMTKLTTVALAIVGLLGASDAVAQRARGYFDHRAFRARNC